MKTSLNNIEKAVKTVSKGSVQHHSMQWLDDTGAVRINGNKDELRRAIKEIQNKKAIGEAKTDVIYRKDR